jgi:hypothetical protein
MKRFRADVQTCFMSARFFSRLQLPETTGRSVQEIGRRRRASRELVVADMWQVAQVGAL